MKVTVISVVTGAFGTVHTALVRGLEELEIGGGAETIQTTVMVTLTRILRSVLEI